MDRYFFLSFVGELAKVELFETEFLHPLLGEPRKSIRGKRSGAYMGYGTFQWTRAVQALSVAVLKAATVEARGVDLLGGQGSLASSLDYALEKQTQWLIEMFGADSQGDTLLKRIFLRSNPGQKRIGPAGVTFNSNFIPLTRVHITWNGQMLASVKEKKQLLQSLSLGEDILEATSASSMPAKFSFAH